MAGGLLSGLGSGLSQAGTTFGGAFAKQKTPAERERARLELEAKRKAGVLGGLKLEQLQTNISNEQAGGALVNQFATDRQTGEALGGFGDTQAPREFNGQAGIGITDPKQLGAGRHEIPQEEFEQRGLADRISGGALPSQLFNERRLQAPSGVSSSKAATDRASLLSSLEPKELSVNDTLKNTKLRAEINKINADKNADEAGIKARRETGKFALSVKDNFEKQKATQSFRVINDKFNKMNSIWSDTIEKGIKERGVVDQVLITLLNKMLDPTSVVRESEYSRTPEGAALLEKMQGKWEALKTGGPGITDDFRKEIIRNAGIMHKASQQTFKTTVTAFNDRIDRWGLKQSDIFNLEDIDILNMSDEDLAKGLQSNKTNNTNNITIQGNDSEAIQWAKDNPDDPRAKEILRQNGVQ